MVLETYRQQFPQLWEDHDLIVRFEQTHSYPYLRRPQNQVETAPTTSTVEYATKINLAHQDATPSSSQELPLSDRLVEHYQGKEAVWVKDGANNSRSLKLASSDSQDILPHPGSQRTVGYVLRLFISGHSETTEEILKNLYQLLENSLHHPYTLKIIDIFKHPEQAEENQISATPTLLRVWPQPARRIVGDFNNVDQILRVLISNK
ncbi:MAG: hypothetical protein F6K47_36245 [Symploca sp. SIO2E6]|nr:hypothetical protein [Symploca sp. SIO2E6]